MTDTRLPIFVFGSNEMGIHGAGAAKYAYEKRGAKLSQGFGLSGTSFAIPTKDWNIKTLPISLIRFYIERFKVVSHERPNWKFVITPIGTGLAGYSHKEIAPLFIGTNQLNTLWPIAWKEYLGEYYRYYEGEVE